MSNSSFINSASKIFMDCFDRLEASYNSKCYSSGSREFTFKITDCKVNAQSIINCDTIFGINKDEFINNFYKWFAYNSPVKASNQEMRDSIDFVSKNIVKNIKDPEVLLEFVEEVVKTRYISQEFYSDNTLSLGSELFDGFVHNIVHQINFESYKTLPQPELVELTQKIFKIVETNYYPNGKPQNKSFTNFLSSDNVQRYVTAHFVEKINPYGKLINSGKRMNKLVAMIDIIEKHVEKDVIVHSECTESIQIVKDIIAGKCNLSNDEKLSAFMCVQYLVTSKNFYIHDWTGNSGNATSIARRVIKSLTSTSYDNVFVLNSSLPQASTWKVAIKPSTKYFIDSNNYEVRRKANTSVSTLQNNVNVDVLVNIFYDIYLITGSADYFKTMLEEMKTGWKAEPRSNAIKAITVAKWRELKRQADMFAELVDNGDVIMGELKIILTDLLLNEVHGKTVTTLFSQKDYREEVILSNSNILDFETVCADKRCGKFLVNVLAK